VGQMEAARCSSDIPLPRPHHGPRWRPLPTTIPVEWASHGCYLLQSLAWALGRSQLRLLARQGEGRDGLAGRGRLAARAPGRAWTNGEALERRLYEQQQLDIDAGPARIRAVASLLRHRKARLGTRRPCAQP